MNSTLKIISSNHASMLRCVILILSMTHISCSTNPNQVKEGKRIYNLGDTREDDKFKSFDTALLNEMKNSHIPGMSLVIVQDGQTIYKKGYGVANVETNVPVDPDKTIFRIGSISKALTLLTLSKLVYQGKVRLDDDVVDYFDGIENDQGFTDPVRIKHLLTHTSGFDQVGLGRHVYNYDQSLDDRKAQRPSISAFLKNKNLRRVTQAGEYYRYDTYGSTLAGVILEKVTGLTYKQAMKQELFDPIGMGLSSVEVEDQHMDQLAVGHGYNDDAYEVMPYEIYNTPPASSIDATPADMGRLLEVLTGGGANKHGSIFTPSVMKNIMEVQYQPHPEFVGISHGLQESNYVGNLPDAYKIRTLGHGGDMLGISCLMTTIPSKGVGIFISSNRNHEAGGERVNLWRLIMPLVMDHFDIPKTSEPFRIPEQPVKVDLKEYVGNYYFGVFCHSCTEEEYAQYAWRRSSRPIEIRKDKNELLLGDDRYLSRGEDVFVRADGYEQIFFGRDENKKISFMVFSDQLNSYERIDD